MAETRDGGGQTVWPPKEIVPRLADRGQYIASESSFYRLLREKKQLVHRGKAKVPTPRPKPQFVSQMPNQVWSWDITYLKSPIRGMYYYLYKVMDVYSRRIVGWAVHEEECNELASTLFREVFFEDESGVRSEFHAGTTWVPRGQTPIVRVTGQRFSLNMISAISAKGELRFMVVKGGVGAKVFLTFLKRLLQGHRGRVYLMVDGHPAHRAKIVKTLSHRLTVG